MKTIGYIFAVLMKVYEKSLTVEEALELIREIVAR
jgi:20S proteasome alpha/beta subunit